RLIEEFTRVGRNRAAQPPELDELTPRELEVLRLLARGLSNGEIADELVLSPLTAKTHVARLFTKLDVRDRAGAVGKAMRLGLVS
ncbi:MAG: response regulator transcription factor, partial [Actinomycetota bacterium]